ncbi:glycosyl hydrolase family 47-domain-containing protein [Apodospora peruviana]|uniref:alpha-1,2-Mannosidase n=1 Tax=Apodospora peruviana TaxID=516989 RepID=A0AAE0IAV7_9PEZI|nr:glycosyl hydrolase family 47-domain-containing protein [Apodospora peruviana]
MLRLRRYRVFMICAFVITVLLYHVSKNSQWERPNVYNKVEAPRPLKPQSQSQPPQKPPSGGSHDETVDRPVPNRETSIKIPLLKTTSEVKGGYGLPKAPLTSTPTSNAVKPHKTDAHETVKVRPPAPTVPQDTVSASDIAIHWKKPKEWFPVATESLIALPTGLPKPMPKVQFQFKEESAAAKEKREMRLAKVKAEGFRAWSGYKQFAWTHDELTPVTKKAKDPFCGWAATLVDALDTLWIMGLKDEFDEAVVAVKAIDFTTTPFRNDIPVFETIIRYLGGLVGAYDVTGGHSGKYRVLLDKALELAEILMGIFDTPNRMPILYYNWQPSYNEGPKRASTVSVAELGSMGMEFTRLAQLTGDNKYYDAIARITDALEELQNRENGTALPGIFPVNLDASGCNRTAAARAEQRAKSEAAQKQIEDAASLSDAPQGYSPDAHGHGSKPDRGTAKDDSKDLEFQVKRDVAAKDSPAPVSAKGLPVDWECVPQGLTSGGYGSDSYSMGGSQDSAYEYFPKQFALLGGLEPKYRAMHEKTVAAVKKYLLFRPMAEGNPDILFSAKAVSPDGTDENLRYEYEVTHLTCFLGGMFGLGGKLFDSPEDVEIGKRLADGCAWAYEVMPTGIMPEFAQILPCEKADDCHWNKTMWYEHLDPEVSWRNTQMEEYYARKAEWKVEMARLKTEKARRQEAAKKAEDEAEDRRLRPANDTLPAGTGAEKPRIDPNIPHDAGKDLRDKESHHNLKRDAYEGERSEDQTDGKKIEEKVKKLESELDLNSDSGYQNSQQQSWDENYQKPMSEIYFPAEPIKPLTHEEYVAQQLKTERLPPGFSTLGDRRYILRPEAIESVWYMYRITGDPIWQEKGWRMFQAVIKATQTEVGHSAIDDVTSTTQPLPADSMESFWLAETLKYFYLLFTEPDVLSLDEWVFNTEAHPFRRPTAAGRKR